MIDRRNSRYYTAHRYAGSGSPLLTLVTAVAGFVAGCAWTMLP